MKLSIAIASFNHCDLLEKCLRALVQGNSLEKELYEILIIDNNSTDRTKEVVSSYINNNPGINIRYIFESKVGLSNARNRAVHEAKGTYIAFIDDDAIADKDWIAEIIKTVQEDPTIAAFGGPVKAYAVKPPLWFPLETSGYNLGPKEKVLKETINEPIGTNMIFKKTALLDEGGFDPNYGVKGVKRKYGEDTDMFQRMIRKGLVVKYIPTVKVDHLIDEDKLGLLWRFKRIIRVNNTCIDMASSPEEVSKFKNVTLTNIGFFLKRSDYYIFRNPLKSLFLIAYSVVSLFSLFSALHLKNTKKNGTV